MDSGAFGEVDRDLNVVKPMTHLQWRHILDLYLLLSRSLRDKLTVVAPDKVGDQVETLSRMAAYAEDIYECVSLSSRVLVPVQKGKLSMSKFYVYALEALGADDPLYVPAIPMKKDATSLNDLAEFVRDTRPHEMHLLGVGPSNRKFDSIRRICGDIPLTCDSNVLTAAVGRVRGGKPRKLTAACDRAEEYINQLLGPKLLKIRGVEVLLDGASSECGDRFAAWANHFYKQSAYRCVWPMRDPSRLRQIKKIIAICDTFAGNSPRIGRSWHVQLELPFT